MERQSFLQGALVLMIAGFITRLMGFLLRILLVRLVGDEVLGLFQMVYPFFITLLLFSTAGFPVAISKLIPEKLANNNKYGAYYLLKITLVFVTIMGSIMALMLYFFADTISQHIFSDQRTYYSLMAMVPALIICPLGSSFRGFFQGFHTMLPTAISQITEQLSRILATLVIINMVGFLGIKYQAAGIALGISVGEFSGLIILIFIFILYFKPYKNFKSRKKFQKTNNKNNTNRSFLLQIKKISRMAIPITIGRITQSLMKSGEAILIPRQLQLGGETIQEATSLYGQLSGMVEQVIYLPTVITIALTTSLIPNVSEAYANNNLTKIKNNYQDILRIITYLGLPITIIFIQRGTEICQLLFGYPEAGTILTGMAFSAPFIYFIQVSSGMLNGLGKPVLAVRNLIIGSSIKLLLIFYLVKEPYLGIKGAVLGITTGYAISALFNFFSIGHNIGYNININHTLLKPLLGSSAIYFLNPYVNDFIDSLVSYNNFTFKTLSELLILIVIYLLIMFLTRAITPKDINRFRK